MNYSNIKTPVKLEKWCVHSYYTLNPYANDGSERLLFAGADLDKKTAQIYIASKDGDLIDSFGEQPYDINFFHTGFWQIWGPDCLNVYYQKGTHTNPLIVKRELKSGIETEIEGTMEGIPPFGEPIISGYMGMLYAAGYGDSIYKPEKSPFPFQDRNSHGLFKFELNQRKAKLIFTVNNILKKHKDIDLLQQWDTKIKKEYGINDGLTLMCYCVRWSPDGERCLFYFGNHTVARVRNEPRIGYVFTADRDFKEIHLAVDLSFGKPGAHWSWHPDGKRLVGYGPDPDMPTKTSICMVNYDGTNYIKICDDRLGGHPSVSPVNYNLLVSDGPYENNLGVINFYEVSSGKLFEKYIVPRRNDNIRTYNRSEHWLCHHPVFSRDGSKVLINTLAGKYGQLKEIYINK